MKIRINVNILMMKRIINKYNKNMRVIKRKPKLNFRRKNSRQCMVRDLLLTSVRLTKSFNVYYIGDSHINHFNRSINKMNKGI